MDLSQILEIKIMFRLMGDIGHIGVGSVGRRYSWCLAGGNQSGTVDLDFLSSLTETYILLVFRKQFSLKYV